MPDSKFFFMIGKLFENEGVSSIAVNKKYRATKAEMLQSFLFHANVSLFNNKLKMSLIAESLNNH